MERRFLLSSASQVGFDAQSVQPGRLRHCPTVHRSTHQHSPDRRAPAPTPHHQRAGRPAPGTGTPRSSRPRGRSRPSPRVRRRARLRSECRRILLRHSPRPGEVRTADRHARCADRGDVPGPSRGLCDPEHEGLRRYGYRAGRSGGRLIRSVTSWADPGPESPENRTLMSVSVWNMPAWVAARWHSGGITRR